MDLVISGSLKRIFLLFIALGLEVQDQGAGRTGFNLESCLFAYRWPLSYYVFI